MKTRMTIIALSLPALFFVFFVICSTIAPYETSVLAQEQKERTTTVADNRYGEGGTHETTSDAKLKLLREFWRDKDGKIREMHFLSYEGTDLTKEDWAFIKDGKTLASFRLSKGLSIFWKFTGKGGVRRTFSASEAHSLIEDIEKQFAKDGTIPKIAADEIAKDAPKSEEKPKQETVEQPKLPRHEAFIDTCLVGTWRSESVVDTLGGRRGGSGIVMTIKADGVITIDYNQMQSLEAEKGGGIGENNWWKGTASGRITTNNRSTSIISVETSELTHKVTVQGKTTTNALTKLGPALPTGYTCDQTTLKWSSAGNAFTFKKKEP